MTAARVRIGLALEYGSDQYAAAPIDGPDFVEYGLQLWRGMPGWVTALGRRHGARIHVHPLDVNLAGPEPDLDAWAERLAALTRRCGATALVTDLGFWYHGRRESTWERPPLMSTSARRCALRAARIARACGVPFRVENPPIEWMPGRPSIWRYLEQASAADGVELCLDVSHLHQFERNVHGRAPRLPAHFPWERVAELHLAGYLVLEYRGAIRRLDQHVAEIGDEQLEVAARILDRRGVRTPLDVCLEMEPRSAESWQAARARVLRALAPA